MRESEWLQQVAKRLAEAAPSYEEQAFYVALQAFIEEQSRRLEQAEGELDGRLWDHQGW